jgi:hypothetical protein
MFAVNTIYGMNDGVRRIPYNCRYVRTSEEIFSAACVQILLGDTADFEKTSFKNGLNNSKVAK